MTEVKKRNSLTLSQMPKRCAKTKWSITEMRDDSPEYLWTETHMNTVRQLLECRSFPSCNELFSLHCPNICLLVSFGDVLKFIQTPNQISE